MDEFETEKFSPLVSELDEECRAGRLPLAAAKNGREKQRHTNKVRGGEKNFSENFKHNFHASTEKKVRNFFCALPRQSS